MVSKKLDEIKKPQPDVLSQSSGMTTTQITSIKEAKELLDKESITGDEMRNILENKNIKTKNSVRKLKPKSNRRKSNQTK